MKSVEEEIPEFEIFIDDFAENILKENIMNNENLDCDGYPTEECLKKIETWPYEDPSGWFDFIFNVWAYQEFGWRKDDCASDLHDAEVIRYSISTAGWSGNESIIEAMQKNEILWMFHWIQSRRGGHYIFEVEKDAN